MPTTFESNMLYEDDELIALNKPPQLACVPMRDLSAPSLLRELENELGRKLYIVHRLDKETTGVIVYAKTATAHRELSMLFEQGAISKVYRLKVHGIPEAEQGVIELPIRAFGSGRMGVDMEKGKPSRTRYRVLERDERTALLEAELLTGRRHQLRVHFYALGHPLVGDTRYGKVNSAREGEPFLLHAHRMRFALFGKSYELLAPLPSLLRLRDE